MLYQPVYRVELHEIGKTFICMLNHFNKKNLHGMQQQQVKFNKYRDS